MTANKTIAACISPHPLTRVLLRAAANSARKLNRPWLALYVETPDHYTADAGDRERVLRFLSMAEDMGAEVRRVEAATVLDGIIAFITSQQEIDEPVSHLIIGQKREVTGLWNRLMPSKAERLSRHLHNLETRVEIIPFSNRTQYTSWLDRIRNQDIKVREIIYGLIIVYLAFVLTEILRLSVSNFDWYVNEHNVMALFLIACVLTALRYGLVPGLVAAITAFTILNYYYIAPLKNFGIDDSADGISLAIFLVSAVLVSLMGALSRAQRTALALKERRTEALFKIHRLASNAVNRGEALNIMHKELSDLLDMEVVFYMPPAINPDSLELSCPEKSSLKNKDNETLMRSWQEMRTTGMGTRLRFGTQWRFEPMITSDSEIGILAVKVPNHIRLDASFGRLLTAIADQAAAILERIELSKMMSESRMREEREKLRSMLLSSVSHDLKTPLASIIGALSVYQRMAKAKRLQPETSNELTATALEEAQRLDSFISNILYMTSIESGEISFESEWVEAGEPVEAIKRRLRHRLGGHNLSVLPPAITAEVRMDRMMTEQVLQNIVDNAVKYAPSDTTITLSYGEEEGGFAYRISDEGLGIPEAKREAIFDKYERLKQSDSQVAGTGLGLAIVKAVMEKQNGTIRVRNHEAGGAEFTVWFPEFKISNERSARE